MLAALIAAFIIFCRLLLLTTYYRFKHALKLDPQNLCASQLAVVYLDQNDTENSEKKLLKSLSVDFGYRSALYNFAVNYKKSHSKTVQL